MAGPNTASPTAKPPVCEMEPIFINCGASEAYTDCQQWTWQVDANFLSGGTYTNGRCLGGDALEDLYCTEHYWNKRHDHDLPGTYEIHVPSGPIVYRFDMHFAETSKDAVGKRYFGLYVEGLELRKSLDISAEAGGKNAPMVITETVLVGYSALTFQFFQQSGGDNPKISAIERCSYSKPRFSPVARN